MIPIMLAKVFFQYFSEQLNKFFIQFKPSKSYATYFTVLAVLALGRNKTGDLQGVVENLF